MYFNEFDTRKLLVCFTSCICLIVVYNLWIEIYMI